MEAELARDLTDHLGEFGLRFVGRISLDELRADTAVLATLAHGRDRQRFRVGYSNALTLSSLSRAMWPTAEGEPLLLLGSRVTERSAAMFRPSGINYLDRAGNAYITFGGVHIDVRGRRVSGRAKVLASRGTRGGVNLFSTKRSQVIFALLAWPTLLQSPVRELADAAGVSLGQAHDTLQLLGGFGYLTEDRRPAPQQWDRLIDPWAAAYPTGLGSAARTERFSGDWQGLEPGTEAVYVSGEAAVPSLLRPETAVLYTDRLPAGLIRARRWQRDDTQPNIFIRRRFWREPQSLPEPGVHDAPWPLIYADLLASNDSRQREAAQRLLQGER